MRADLSPSMGGRLAVEAARRLGVNLKLDLVLPRGATGVQRERAQIWQSHERCGAGMSCKKADQLEQQRYKGR